jgi:hypothetical protein
MIPAKFVMIELQGASQDLFPRQKTYSAKRIPLIIVMITLVYPQETRLL